MEGRESSRRLGRKWWVFQNREEGITLKCSPLKRHLPTIHNLWSPGNCTYHNHDSSHIPATHTHTPTHTHTHTHAHTQCIHNLSHTNTHPYTNKNTSSAYF